MRSISNLDWIAAGLVMLAAALAAAAWTTSAGDSATRYTIRLALAWYFVASALMLRLRADDWHAGTPTGRAARWCWTWGLVCYLVHVAFAFGAFHHFSHEAAFEHTRATSGVGEGLYVNYLFTLVWIIDAVTWWCAPAWYASRSRLLEWLTYGFMLFIVFNGAVVYAAGPVRWASAAGVLMLAALWMTKRLGAGRTSTA